jgi:hypothetical protein
VSLPWFRLYAELATDPKIQILAFEDQRHYVMLLCRKCNGTLDSAAASNDLRERLIARSLGLALPEAVAARKRLVDAGLIDKKWQPLAWEKRQMQSDGSASRVKRYRDKRESNGMGRGWDAFKFRAPLIERDGSSGCVYCGSNGPTCIDHMVPIAQGGNDDLDNLAFACKGCNSGKAGRTPEQASMVFKSSTARLAHSRYLSRHVTVTVTAKSRPRSEQIRTEQKEALKSAPPEPEKAPEARLEALQKLRTLMPNLRDANDR